MKYLTTIFLSVHVLYGQRYLALQFERCDTLSSLSYGHAVGLDGILQPQLLDIYRPPVLDTVVSRPLILFIHGGGFLSGSRIGGFGAWVATEMARRGYVAASIDYRLGIDSGRTDADYRKAFLRAVQDVRAAIRFMKDRAVTFGVDTQQVFLMGSSAGAMAALGAACLSPEEIGASAADSPNGSSAMVQGIINCWGAVTGLSLIGRGKTPVFSIHGDMDRTVPYDSSFAWHGFRYGSLPIFQEALRLGIPTGYLPFPGAGHTPVQDPEKRMVVLEEILPWLYARLHQTSASRSELGVRRFEKEIEAFDQLNQVAHYPAAAVLVTGSSFVRLWENVGQDLAPLPVIHRGFGGSNSAEMAYYAGRIAFPHNLKAIVLYTGSNDLAVSPNDKTPVQIRENVIQVGRILRSQFPDIPIIWIEIAPSPRRWKVWDRISETNRLMRDYAASHTGWHTVSVADAFLGQDGLPVSRYFGSDNLHYNAEGYMVWGRTLRKGIHRILGLE